MSTRKGTRQSAGTKGFTDVERAAMKELTAAAAGRIGALVRQAVS